MRGQTLSVLFLIAVLSLFAADACGEGYVHGKVTQKLTSQPGEPDRQLVINGKIFQVPISFYNLVQVGDMVRFNGRDWTIEQPTPATTPPPPPPPVYVPSSP